MQATFGTSFSCNILVILSLQKWFNRVRQRFLILYNNLVLSTVMHNYLVLVKAEDYQRCFCKSLSTVDPFVVGNFCRPISHHRSTNFDL